MKIIIHTQHTHWLFDCQHSYIYALYNVDWISLFNKKQWLNAQWIWNESISFPFPYFPTPLLCVIDSPSSSFVPPDNVILYVYKKSTHIAQCTLHIWCCSAHFAVTGFPLSFSSSFFFYFLLEFFNSWSLNDSIIISNVIQIRQHYQLDAVRCVCLSVCVFQSKFLWIHLREWYRQCATLRPTHQIGV